MRQRETRRPTLAVLGLIAGVGVLGTGVALAQKPGLQQQPAPAPQQRLPTTKPPALGAPQPPRPMPQQPPPPRVVTPAPAPSPAPAPGGKPSATPPTAPSLGAPTTPPQAPPVATPAPQPIPANEPPGITALRELFPGGQLNYATAETVDPTTGRARMTGVETITADGTRTTFDEVIVEQASRQGARYLLLRNLQGRNGTDRTVIAELELRDVVVRQPADGGKLTPDMVDIGQFTLRDGRVIMPDGQVSVAGATVEGWGQGRPTRIEMNGFEVTFPPAGSSPIDRIAIGRMAMAGTDLPGVIVAGLAGRPTPHIAGEPYFEAENLTAGTQGQNLVSIAGFGARSRVDATGSGNGTIGIRGARVLPMPSIADWMTRYGYAAISAELTAEMAYDAARGRIDLSAFRVAGQDIGTLTLSFLLDGMTQQAMLSRDFSGVRLFGANLGWLDQSILQRVIRDMARSMGSTEQAVRDQWAGMASGVLAQRGAAGLESIREALVRYIRGQASQIDIRAQPPQPVPVMQLGTMGSPAQVQQTLGITATAR